MVPGLSSEEKNKDTWRYTAPFSPAFGLVLRPLGVSARARPCANPHAAGELDCNRVEVGGRLMSANCKDGQKRRQFGVETLLSR